MYALEFMSPIIMLLTSSIVQQQNKMSNNEAVEQRRVPMSERRLGRGRSALQCHYRRCLVLRHRPAVDLPAARPRDRDHRAVVVGETRAFQVGEGLEFSQVFESDRVGGLEHGPDHVRGARWGGQGSSVPGNKW